MWLLYVVDVSRCLLIVFLVLDDVFSCSSGAFDDGGSSGDDDGDDSGVDDLMGSFMTTSTSECDDVDDDDEDGDGGNGGNDDYDR